MYKITPIALLSFIVFLLIINCGKKSPVDIKKEKQSAKLSKGEILNTKNTGEICVVNNSGVWVTITVEADNENDIWGPLGYDTGSPEYDKIKLFTKSTDINLLKSHSCEISEGATEHGIVEHIAHPSYESSKDNIGYSKYKLKFEKDDYGFKTFYIDFKDEDYYYQSQIYSTDVDVHLKVEREGENNIRIYFNSSNHHDYYNFEEVHYDTTYDIRQIYRDEANHTSGFTEPTGEEITSMDILHMVKKYKRRRIMEYPG